MNRPARQNVSPRIKVNALLSASESAALYKLLGKLTLEGCRQFAENDDDAYAFAEVASKLRRQLNAAEEIPQLPDFDD